jgi:CO dehydrogenase maturation factor
MGRVIAVAGKGGTGKTTTACLVTRYLVNSPHKPILAVDADPNSNLGETMGIDVTKTVGDIREDFMKDPQGLPPGMDKVNYLEMLMNQVLIERKDFDLLVMGRQEGTGCYCMVNNILNRFSEELSKHYSYLVVDNEAGMEHLSRRTSGRVDMLLMVTDYSLRGLRALKRIHEMLGGLKLDIRDKGMLVTRAPEKLSDAFMAEAEAIGVPIIGLIPDDPMLLDYDMEKRSLMELPDHSSSVAAVNAMMDKIMPV